MTQNDTMLLDCMQKADIKDVIANQYVQLSYDDYTVGSSFPFLPVLDTLETSDTPFFNDTSIDNMMQQALLRAKPLITGFTTDEGILKFMDKGWQVAEGNLGAFIPPKVRDSISKAERSSLADTIKSRYYPDSVDENKIESAVRVYTDAMFSYPSLQVTRYFANLTYGYLFAYNGAWAGPPSSFSVYKMTGVGHGADLYYLLYVNGSSQYVGTCTPNLPNLQMKDQMVKWWTSFAKNGVPGLPWETISEGGYLIIDGSDPSKMNTTEFESQFYDFWANMKPQSGNSADPLSRVLCVYIINNALLSVFHHIFKV
uniref:Carboxylesterase type B domain-containing protein n=1 Tax=Homalodisca liturata TaxID=320908 RepID=A0A1B6IKG3_9HEMI